VLAVWRKTMKDLFGFDYDLSDTSTIQLATKSGEVIQWFEEHKNDETDECIIWPFSVDGHGYGHMGTHKRVRKVAIIVCELRYGPKPSPEYEAAHGSCHNRACINYRHLSWKTHRDNSLDRHRDRTISSYFGINNPNSRLTEQQIVEIRELYHVRGWSRRNIVRKFNIQHYHAQAIINGKIWKHVPMPVQRVTIPDLFA
jgi:hypothetical protein